MNQRTFFLVYQGGIANIFEVECANLDPYGRNARRVYQGGVRTAEAIAKGLAIGMHIVHSAACNMAGDISNQKWTDDLDNQPFSDKFNPVKQVTCIF